MCTSVYVCCCFELVSLQHSHPSLQPFATWPVNYLFLLTHTHRENKPLSHCLDRLHNPPPTSQKSFLSFSPCPLPLWTRARGLRCLTPKPIKLSSALAGVRVLEHPRPTPGWSLNSHQEEVFIRHLLVNDTSTQYDVDLRDNIFSGKTEAQTAKRNEMFCILFLLLRRRQPDSRRAACYAILTWDTVKCVYVYLHQ